MAVKLLKRLILALGGISLLSGMFSIAAGASNDQLVTETFSLPPTFYGLGYLNHPVGYGPDFKNYVLGLPPDYAHKELEKAGVTFPEDTLLLLDAEWGTLTVRNTPDNLAKIRQYLSNQMDEAEPTLLSFTTHLIQAPGPLLRMLAHTAGGDKDQTQDLQRLLAEANTPESTVKVLHTAYLGCREAQWAELDNLFEKNVCTDLTLDAQGRVTVDTDFQPAGFRLKATPDTFVRSRSHKSISINLSPSYSWSFPAQPKERLTEPVTGSVMEWPVSNRQQVSLETSFSLRHGQTMLVGQWPVKETAATNRADQARALFITAHIHALTPATTQANIPAPAFFSAPDKEVTQWSTPLPPAFLNKHSQDELTHAEKLLEKHDISMPEKSSATLSSSGTLTVRSDPATLAQVYAWTQKVKASRESDLGMTLEVYSAPATFIRYLLARHAPSSNHSEALAEVRRAVDAREAQLVTRGGVNARSGQWSQLSAVHEHRYIERLSWRKTGPPLIMTDTRAAGLTLDISPRFEQGSHGAAIHYTLEQHTGPQTLTRELLKDPASQQSFNYPHSHFQMARIKSADSFEFGIPKIISVWQRMGTDGLAVDDTLEVAFLTCNRIPIWGRLPVQIVLDTSDSSAVKTLSETSENHPKTLQFTLNVIEASAQQIQSLADQYATVEDHTPVLEALLEQVKTGQASVQATLALSTLAGLRATATEEQEHSSLVGVSLDGKGGSEMKHEQVAVGSSMEVDPVLSSDGVTIAAIVTLDHHTAPPTKREENLAADGNPPVLVPLIDFHRVKVTTALTLASGTARILSIWKPTGKPEHEKEDLLQIAILQGRATKID